ncbi:MAG TPA: GNAT family N-acetyltransferase [Cytophagales bacterium]|nr:GNAT family N-acetyltransferase [Cytophagales bacterium]HCR54283.1 GNAT family N-acetyltransferase [Cytophagales bacterium]
MRENLTVRSFEEKDREAIWNIISEVIAGGETYVFYPNSSKDKMLDYWLAPDKKIYVAQLEDEIVATFTIKPNMPDRGSHIANGSYMVSPGQGGKGIGEFIGRYSLTEAKKLGYQAMQFNIVIKSNERAVNLWKKIGFKIIGEVPNAFQHPRLGMTNAYIMYKEL